MISGEIVVISQNQSLCFVFQTLFGRRFKILCAEDAVGGQRLLQTHQPGVVILDLDFNTEETVEFIHYIQSSWLHAMPVILLSTDQELMNSFPPSESLHHFPKPFNPLNLMSLAEQLLTKQLKHTASI